MEPRAVFRHAFFDATSKRSPHPRSALKRLRSSARGGIRWNLPRALPRETGLDDLLGSRVAGPLTPRLEAELAQVGLVEHRVRARDLAAREEQSAERHRSRAL